MERNTVVISRDELIDLRKYFSYCIRAETSMIVSTVTLLQLYDKIDTDESSETSQFATSIVEAAFILDIYDKASELILDYAIIGRIPPNHEVLEPSKIINHVISKVRNVIAINNINLSVKTEDYKIANGRAVIKSLIETILIDILKRSDITVNITSSNKVIEIRFSKPIADFPSVFNTFKVYFNVLDTQFTFDKERITFKFN